MNLTCYYYAMDFPENERKFGRHYNFNQDDATEAVLKVGMSLGARVVYGPYETEEELVEHIYCKENDL